MDKKLTAAFMVFATGWVVSPTDKLPLAIQAVGSLAIFISGCAVLAQAVRMARK